MSLEPSGRGRARQRGAAILILLTIVSLGAATMLVSALGKINLQTARERKTLMILAQSREALLGFAVANGRLPRPAVSAVDGLENPQACGREESCTGFLPWVALGVEGSDSWGKRLRYSVTPGLTRAPLEAASVRATKTVLGRDGGGALQFLAGQAECGLGAECAPFVVLSHGKNNFGSGETGARMANGSAGNWDEINNQATSSAFISRTASAAPGTGGGEFDDLVTWIPFKTLLNRLKAAGKLH